MMAVVLAGHGWLVMLTPERAPPHRDAVVLWLEDGWTCKHVSSTCCNVLQFQEVCILEHDNMI
jgi:hypothetical protein